MQNGFFIPDSIFPSYSFDICRFLLVCGERGGMLSPSKSVSV